MPATALQLDVAATTHTGKVRAANQDAYGYSAEGHVFVLCDGMGGAAGGEVASRVGVEAFLERVGARPAGSSPARLMEQAVSAANRIIYTRAQRESALHGMGTTLVALVIGERHRAWIAHVGDSRCYLWRRGLLARCTEDHSLIEEQVRLGTLSAEQAASSPLRHVITRAVGVRRTVSVEVRDLTVEPGDLFLLCSDGLTREVEEPRIGELLAAAVQPRAGLRVLCQCLIEEALLRGGADNITCLAVRVE